MTSTAALVIIGDEILSGKTEDLNSPFMIEQLRGLGVALVSILTVPDDPEWIARVVRDLSPRLDHIFTSGGVGPTHDDVTIAGVARAFDREIVRHPELKSRIRSFLGENAGESHFRMADVPEQSELIESPDLRWPVLVCENVYVLPGPPELFRQKFLAIRDRFRETPFFVKILYTMEDEFDVSSRLRTVVREHPEVQVGSYPSLSESGYRVKLTLESKNAPALEAALDSLLAMLDRDQLIRHE